MRVYYCTNLPVDHTYRVSINGVLFDLGVRGLSDLYFALFFEICKIIIDASV